MNHSKKGAVGNRLWYPFYKLFFNKDVSCLKINSPWSGFLN